MMPNFLYFLLNFHLFWIGIEGNKAIDKGGVGKQELLLRNITQILDRLLQDYDSSQHPNYQFGKPTRVTTNMMIRSMGPISELDMMLERLWRPDTFFRNGRHSYVHTITVPNKLLRLSQEGDILYSMRLTIKAKCEMCLKNFPLDSQSCPLIFGSFAYPSRHIIYSWDESGVSFVPGMALSQFDLVKYPFKSRNITNEQGEFSVLEVKFELVRHAGFFLIQVYVPCILIVILSWVSFWINRESTSDRVGLGITAFLTLSTISLDTRTDLPKVHYATALDWFILMSFGYCMASLLEFAGVHYFTKVNSGERQLEDEEDEDEIENEVRSEEGSIQPQNTLNNAAEQQNWRAPTLSTIMESGGGSNSISRSIMESKETQTEKRISCFRQFLQCIVADEKFRRRQRQRAAASGRSTNSVSKIDKVSRILFPLSFLFLNIFYWVMYAYFNVGCEKKRSMI